MASAAGPDGKRQKTGGRQVNTRNRLNQEAVAQAKATGELPADILLRVARDAAKDYDLFMGEAEALFAPLLAELPAAEKLKASMTLAMTLAKQRVATREHVIAAAEAAAPYFNSRLATVQHNVRGRIVVGRRRVTGTSGEGAKRAARAAADTLEIIEEVTEPKANSKRDPRAPKVRIKKRRPKDG